MTENHKEEIITQDIGETVSDNDLKQGELKTVNEGLSPQLMKMFYGAGYPRR